MTFSNEEKTRICKVPEGEFDFLGYTFGRMFSARTGQARIGYRPSKKSIQRVVPFGQRRATRYALQASSIGNIPSNCRMVICGVN